MVGQSVLATASAKVDRERDNELALCQDTAISQKLHWNSTKTLCSFHLEL